MLYCHLQPVRRRSGWLVFAVESTLVMKHAALLASKHVHGTHAGRACSSAPAVAAADTSRDGPRGIRLRTQSGSRRSMRRQTRSAVSFGGFCRRVAAGFRRAGTAYRDTEACLATASLTVSAGFKV